MQETLTGFNLSHHTKVSSLCRLYGSVDLMAIDQMSYLFKQKHIEE